jgi:hypothetical protein
MPDRIEVASSSRARCRACRRSIAKGIERFAEAVPNPVAEGESQHYYHLECASERRPKAFAGVLAAFEPARTDLEPLERAAALALEHHRLDRLGVLERSKSARASCRQCREAIEKGAWRVALQPIEEGRLAAWGFVHLGCAGAYVGVKPELARLTRYTELEPADVTEIATALEAMPVPEPRSDADEDDDAPGGVTPSASPGSATPSDAG